MPKFFSDGHFSGSSTDLTIDGKLVVNGGDANLNSGKADVSIGAGGNPQISLLNGNINFGSTDMNWNSKFFYNGTTQLAAWDNNIKFYGQGGSDDHSISFWPNVAGTATQKLVVDAAGVKGTIFYDLDDTTYFSNPASTGTSLNVAGAIQLPDAKAIMWAGNNIISHNGTQTYIGDNASASSVTITDGNVTIGGTSINATRSLTLQTNSEQNTVINLKEANANYGFSLMYDGAVNDFIIKRHDNSSGGVSVLTLNRTDNHATFSGNILPGTDNSQNLGSSTKRWQNVVAVNLHGDGSNITNLPAQSAPSNMVTTDTTQTISGTKTFSVQPTFDSDILVNGHVYGRSVNSQYSLLYRFGGLFFTWDSDSYGTNTHHSIRSTYGDSFTDSITLNSFNHFRVNIDSNNNNSTSYFEVGDGTTGTGNIKFRVDNHGRVYSSNGYHDIDDTNYWIKPADSTAIQVKGRILSYNPAGGNLNLRTTYAKRYGINSEDNHVTALTNEGWTDGGTSNRAVTALVLGNTDWSTSGSKDMLALTRVNTAAYSPSTGQGSYQKVFSVRGNGDLHLGYNSSTGAAYATKYYDKANTGYYLDPGAGSKLLYLGLAADPNSSGSYRLNMGGSIDMNDNSIDYINQLHFNANVRFYDESNDSTLYYKYGDTGYGQIKFQDGNGTATGTIYAESGYFGTLSPDQSWAVQSSNTLTNILHQVRSPIFYDKDDTNYYLDPGNSTTSLYANGKLYVNGGHSTGRLQINYQHGSNPSTDSNSTTLTAWASEPGISYNGAGIGANIHVSGQYYGRAYDTGYGVYTRFDKANGRLEHWTTQGNSGTSGGQGTRQWYNDASGNSFATTSSRAPIFRDSNDTNYYLDAASSSIALKINGIIDQSFEQTDLNTAWTTPGSSFAQGFIVGRYQSTASNIPSNNDNANWFMNIYSHSSGGTASYGIQLAGSNASSGENALSLRNVSNGSFSSWRKVYHEGHKPTYTELGTMAYSNLTGDLNIGGLRIVSDNDSTDQGTAWIRSNGDYIVINPVDGEHLYLNWDTGQSGGSGHVYVADSVFSTTFYDRNDTAYYLNPSTTGTSINLAGKITMADNKPVEWPNGSIRAEGNELKLVASTNTKIQSTLMVQNETMDTDGQSIKGYRLNKATSSSWTAGGTGNQTGFYGGSFGGSEITTKWVDGPHGERTLAAETSGDTGNDYDGGYVKQITNLDINKSHLSVVYIKRISSGASGNVYHGTGAGTNQITNLAGSSNTNPYFHYPGMNSFPQDVWCVSIGVIQANNDSNTDASKYTGSSALQGIYRCDTGQKILNSSNAWKMGSSGSTLSNGIRFFHYYSTDASAKLQWAKPGFYEINGDEPTLSELLSGGASRGLHTNGGDVTANKFYDWANKAYYVDPASDSVMNQIHIDDYIRHKGDLDTYLGFSGENTQVFYAGGSHRMSITGDVHIEGTTDLNINGSSRRINFTSGSGTIRTTTGNSLILQTNNTDGIVIDGSTQNIVAPARITIGQNSDAGSTYRLYTAAGGQVYFGGHLTGTSATFSGTIDNGSNYANLGNVNFVGIGNSPVDSGTGGGTGSGSGKLLGFNQLNGSGRASATLGVNEQGIVMEFEKIFTFKVSGSGWLNRSTNAYKLIQAPGADKMLIVDEFMVYIDYETRTGIGSSGIAYHSDSTAYSIGFFENETGQQNMTGANFVVGGTYYTLGIMPRDFMAAASTDRGFYQDVPKTKSRVLPNRSLFWKTMRNCTSTGNAPGGAHYIKIKYRILDISEEFNNAGVNHIIDSSSYHGRYAHTANLDKSYNDAGQAVQ